MKRPLRVVVMGSGGMSLLRYLAANDPNFGITYEIVGAFSDVQGSAGIEYADTLGIKTCIYDFSAWCKANKVERNNVKERGPFFKKVLAIVKRWKPDVILLSGFMLRITDPFLAAFAGRMLNIHPAFLSILNEKGERKYTGLKVVARAMEAGDPTGSTLHIVTNEPDMGPIVTESDPLPPQPGVAPTAHQELMKTECDGPACQKGFEILIANDWPEVPWEPAKAA